MNSITRLVVAALAVTMIAGCAHRRAPAPAPAPQYGGYNSGAQGGYNSGYYGNGQHQQLQLGVVHSIDPLRAENRTSGGGALVGGAIGGLLGHQVDRGNRRAAATVVGAVAGAIIGNQIEKNNAGIRDGYRVAIRLDSGEVRSYDYAQLNEIRVGDRVRIDAGNQVYRY
jgi:outer membrane lipoprotein SlyB